MGSLPSLRFGKFLLRNSDGRSFELEREKPRNSAAFTDFSCALPQALFKMRTMIGFTASRDA
ncbi:MAG: hypothetical protein GY725_22310 [bacterium]|nr:hypothetical protein [bacterium]